MSADCSSGFIALVYETIKLGQSHMTLPQLFFSRLWLMGSTAAQRLEGQWFNPSLGSLHVEVSLGEILDLKLWMLGHHCANV